jgi:hypothetical protein
MAFIKKPLPKEDPKPQPKPVWKEGLCTECLEPVAPGQTYVCTKHIRN